jgi:hypothetical protein
VRDFRGRLQDILDAIVQIEVEQVKWWGKNFRAVSCVTRSSACPPTIPSTLRQAARANALQPATNFFAMASECSFRRWL